MLLRPYLAVQFILLCLVILLGHAPVFASETDKNELNLDWGDWNQSIMEVDVYTLPLTPQQHEILNVKINQLKQKYGVGIVGDIELAINQMDGSNLLNEASNAEKDAMTNRNPLIKDDLLLEEEIKALEFAKSIERDDPEGLMGKTQHSQELFNKILKQLEQLEQKRLTEKVN